MEVTRIAIIDVSGSMNHSFSNELSNEMTTRVSRRKTKFEAALDYLRFAIQKMPSDSELIIIAFAGNASVVYHGSVQNKRRIEESISQLEPNGGNTLLGSAFELVLQLLRDERLRIRPLDVITDGLSEDDPTEFARILQRQYGVYIHLYLIDPSNDGLVLSRKVVGEDGEVDPISSASELSTAQDEALSQEREAFQLMSRLAVKHERALAVFKNETIEQERPRVKIAFPQYLKHKQWRSLDVFVYLEQFSKLVNREVEKQRITDGDDYEGLSFQLRRSLPEGTLVKVVLNSETIQVNPKEITFGWYEPYNKLPFRISPLKEVQNGNATIDVEIYADNLNLGSIELPIFITEEDVRPEIKASNLMLYESVFASYAREDVNIAKHFKRRYAALGVYLFIDLEDLRAGAFWRNALFEKIDESDLFQLFWSESSKDSENVTIEWQHALELLSFKGSRFVRPIYWKEPMPETPDDLSEINFRYVDLNDL